MQTQALLPPPPHPLFVAAGHLLSPALQPNSLTALIHHIRQTHLSYLMGHPSLERTPLSEPQSQRRQSQRRGEELGGGGRGGGRAGKRMCCI
jgi:hypothetical protein